jgi:glycine/D-amino acid oxidase-like deaminating enzyme
MLDRRALSALLPDIGPQVAGASYCRLDGSIDPLRLLRALLLAFQRRGGVYLASHRVTKIEALSEGYGVTAGGKRVQGAKLVLAAGLANATLAPLVGIALPISPLRGQMLITEKQPQWLGTTTHIVRQMGDGGVLIGDSQEDAGYDDGTVLGVMGNIAERAVKAFPRLAQANVVRAWGCLRIMTPDGIPIYEESRTHPGAYAFAVHSGVTLAAFHASALADAVANGNLGNYFAPFSGDRFALSQPREEAA